MLFFLLKTFLTALVIVTVTEVAKRYSYVAAIIASLPLTSILVFVWMHLEGVASEKIIRLSYDVGLAVLPSLLFFPVFGIALKIGVPFWGALLLSSAIMAVAYSAYLAILHRYGMML